MESSILARQGDCEAQPQHVPAWVWASHTRPCCLHCLQHLISKIPGVDLCNHGNYCGEDCSGKDYTQEPWDELDRACRDHDWWV